MYGCLVPAISGIVAGTCATSQIDVLGLVATNATEGAPTPIENFKSER